MSGPIPPALGELPALLRIELAGNDFSGCIPAGLRKVESNDLNGVGLPYCE